MGLLIFQQLQLLCCLQILVASAAPDAQVLPLHPGRGGHCAENGRSCPAAGGALLQRSHRLGLHKIKQDTEEGVQASAEPPPVVVRSSNGSSSLPLLNPSLLEMPGAWRQQESESWLAAFHKQDLCQAAEERVGTSPCVHNSLVLSVLDAEMRPTRPLQELRPGDFFAADATDCKSSTGLQDPRLFRPANSSKILLLFTAVRSSSLAAGGSSCSPFSRQHIAELPETLLPLRVDLIMMHAENASTDTRSLVIRATEMSETIGNLAPMALVVPESWPYGVAAQPSPQLMLMERSVEPHILLDFDPESKIAGARIWNTSSPELQAWLAQRPLAESTTHALHGGGAPLLISKAPKGFPVDGPFYLSVLSHLSNGTYQSFLYAFEASQPFRIRWVADRQLPLQTTRETLPPHVSLLHPSTDVLSGKGSSREKGDELWVLYSSGDSAARRLVIPWAGISSFLQQTPLVPEPDWTENNGGRTAKHLPMSETCILGAIFIITLFMSVSAESGAANSATMSWMMASIGMNIFNKEAAGVCPAILLLVILQMMVANMIVVATKHQDLKVKSWASILRWVPVPIFFASMLASSLFALKETTVTTVLILRNVLPLFSFVAEKVLFGTPLVVNYKPVLALLVTLFGTVVYGCDNISVTHHSAALILFNCVVSVCDRLLQRHLLICPEFHENLAVCMVANNTIGLLPLLILALWTGETETWASTLHNTNAVSWFVIVLSSVAGCALGYLGLKVARAVTATMVLVLQNVSKLSVVLLGILLYGDSLTFIAAAGSLVSLGGSAWYSQLMMPPAAIQAPDKKTRNDALMDLKETSS
ncbi:unnamed protein product [Polarella glacialis]|uniref:Sugar phosphate transporter domain-containing protein n=2 Tax=Polarella glacialis TaxID=89957 RepID=A0A813JXM1_POLGL|nr:unnamed protein product [Polarella glacialis]